ncbi:hypothetical protein VT98_12312 [Candidatus Electrothrix communis]|uniref:Uncharacterized protein n=1 Tax=Candidatus Electrothrix communis TaxID=1859133 RepID=A0A3S3R974_9BACT|nr:hypothetical protein VT98_12312 [Candidatus Electrothrix communis]
MAGIKKTPEPNMSQPEVDEKVFVGNEAGLGDYRDRDLLSRAEALAGFIGGQGSYKKTNSPFQREIAGEKQAFALWAAKAEQINYALGWYEKQSPEKAQQYD